MCLGAGYVPLRRLVIHSIQFLICLGAEYSYKTADAYVVPAVRQSSNFSPLLFPHQVVPEPFNTTVGHVPPRSVGRTR